MDRRKWKLNEKELAEVRSEYDKLEDPRESLEWFIQQVTDVIGDDPSYGIHYVVRFANLELKGERPRSWLSS